MKHKELKQLNEIKEMHLHEVRSILSRATNVNWTECDKADILHYVDFVLGNTTDYDVQDYEYALATSKGCAVKVIDYLRQFYDIPNQYASQTNKQLAEEVEISVAYIRNKLTPLTNLLAIIGDYRTGNNALDQIIEREIMQSAESMKSIVNELDIISTKPTTPCDQK